MTVYIKTLRAPSGRLTKCQMLADSDDELHALAQRIRIHKRRWNPPENHHAGYYDVPLTMRADALRAGAVSVSLLRAQCMSFRRMWTGHLGSPETARNWWKECVLQQIADLKAARAVKK